MGISILQAVTPRLSSCYQNSNAFEFVKLSSASLVLTTIIGLIMIIVFSYFGEEVLLLFYGNKYINYTP